VQRIPPRGARAARRDEPSMPGVCERGATLRIGMPRPGEQVRCKKKCCRSGKRCKKCPVVWKKLSKQGFAEREGKLSYTVVEIVPKRAFKAARA